jgi:hypothetical protein
VLAIRVQILKKCSLRDVPGAGVSGLDADIAQRLSGQKSYSYIIYFAIIAIGSFAELPFRARWKAVDLHRNLQRNGLKKPPENDIRVDLRRSEKQIY